MIGQVAEELKDLGEKISSSFEDSAVPGQNLEIARTDVHSDKLGDVVKAAKTCEYLLELYAMTDLHKEKIEYIRSKVEEINPAILETVPIDLSKFSTCAICPG